MLRMDDFKTFQQIFSFFLLSELDVQYVHSVESSDNSDLTETISAFHTMRTNLCKTIIEHVGSIELFNSFVDAASCLQYDMVPAKSTCILSGVTLAAQDGILIIVDNRKLFTFHKRLKVVVLTFWYILNLPSELTKESIKWYRETAGNSSTDATDICNIITKHNNNMFVKRAYVRFLNSVKFIQNDMEKVTVIR
tara:strand:+ start:1780 stop:2361 length:582 start_codon:yes stop_codon:yes gene_type:complete